jgi:hypothetical protein
MRHQMRRRLPLLAVLALPLSSCTGPSADPAGTAPAAWQWHQADAGQLAPLPRDAQSMVYDTAAGSVIVFGGKGTRDRYFNDLWAYHVTAATWTRLTPAGPLPAPRFGQGMAYDPELGEIVIFGGVAMAGTTPRLSAETWTYSSRTRAWVRSGRAGDHPPARLYPSTVYDPVTRTVILFGGWTGADAFSDTWSYDARTGRWTRISTIGAPPARWGAAMAYDAATGKIILFGGLFGGYDGTRRLGDTWAYDPSARTWTHLKLAGQAPSARGYAATAYEQSARKVILFGGFAGPHGLLDDAWSYDAVTSRWTRIGRSRDEPSRRDFSSMAYDPATNRIVLFGGQTGTTGNVDAVDLNDTWLLRTS